MSLRTKCALLLIAFELTLAVTLIYTVRYIGIYFEDAAEAFKHSSAGVAGISRLQTLARNELTHLLQYVRHPSADMEAHRINEDISRAAEALTLDWPEALSASQHEYLTELLSQRRNAAAAFLENENPSTPDRFNPEAHLKLDAFLGQLESQMLNHVHASINSTFIAQKKATLILSINMIVGAGLGILGMVLVRRWVLLPIHELKLTTDELGKGRLDHRAEIRSEDEFGQLAAAINKMSEDLARIERQMILRERAAAMGELVSYIAHNIRNPLAGIRSLAESCQSEGCSEEERHSTAREMTGVIEKLQRWLRELEHTCSTLTIQPATVKIQDLVENVVAVFRPMSERRSITVNQSDFNGIEEVDLDERHFEQALAAVVANAIEAVGQDGHVDIGLASNGDPGHWLLSVTDSGPGIPDDVRHKILDPAFSTKRSGQGLGLAMARKVAQLHGGELTFECPEEGGTVFMFRMPRQPNADMKHG